MDTNFSINVYHQDWIDKIKINKDILYKESNPDIKTDDFFINEHFLKIKWNNKIDYFLSIDEINYYHHCSRYYDIFFKNYSYYFITDKFSQKLLLACHYINICYDLNNIEMYYFFDLNNDEFILYDEKNENYSVYVLFLNKYYEKNYFNTNFKKLNIDNDTFNNEIIINLNNNIFYNNVNINGFYINYGNYLNLKYLNKNFLYIKENNIYKYLETKNNFTNLEEFNFKLIKNKENTIIFIFNCINNHELLFYLSNNDFNLIVFDNLKNKHSNSIYQNLNIVYYKNQEDINFILNKIEKMKKIKYYFSNIDNIIINNKYNLHNNIEFPNLVNLFNIQSKSTKFEQFKKKSNFNYIKEDIKFIKNSKIPKILHFIWLGENQFPNLYNLFLNSWIDKYPDFLFCFWNDDNIFELFNQNIFDKSLTYAQKSDILRYEILYFYGGIYIDSDCYSIKNLENLLNNIDFFSGYESDKYIAIGLMGFSKNNEYLKKYIINLELNYHIYSDKNIPFQTGPVYFTQFYENFINEFNNYKFFEPNTFYNYSFQNKLNNLPIIFKTNNYSYHSWGFSWDENKIHKRFNCYHLIKFIYNNIIHSVDEVENKKNHNCLKTISEYYKNLIFYKKNKNINNKINVINIIGYFFTGGIEKYILDIDKYGDHKKFNYILLYLNKKQYNLKPNLQNITFYSYFDNKELITLLNILDPTIIIDHYSQYIDYNIYYHNIYNNITIHLIHSAINYNKDISTLKINKCIHLYNENNKNPSWNKIKNNYYNTLGINLNQNNDITKIINMKQQNLKKNNYIIIAIIGRIVEEKIPIDFFEKLCKLSNNCKNICIQIYGSQNNIFNSSYNIKFNNLIKESSIEFYGQLDYKDIYKIYEKINYILIPSKFETGSYTCLEAISYGIPIICRNNYGLKKIIKNNISGHLLNNDDEIIEKIKYLNEDNILHNNYIIYNESLKYNIIDKISRFEDIIEQNISNKNLVIVTSVLNISKKSLSYYSIRSMFNIEERFKQTKKTIKTIKKYIPNYFILFCECSDLTNYDYIEKYLKNNVDVYNNYNEDKEVKNNIESIYKGSGENSLMIKAIEHINDNNLIFDNVFKISARYFLNDDFKFTNYNNCNNQFSLWDNNFESYATLFYKIKFKYLNLLNECFLGFINKLKNGEALEILINKYFNLYMNYQNIIILEKHNISGYLSTEGYFFTI